jgi:hypothetical protein
MFFTSGTHATMCRVLRLSGHWIAEQAVALELPLELPATVAFVSLCYSYPTDTVYCKALETDSTILNGPLTHAIHIGAEVDPA